MELKPKPNKVHNNVRWNRPTPASATVQMRLNVTEAASGTHKDGVMQTTMSLHPGCRSAPAVPQACG